MARRASEHRRGARRLPAPETCAHAEPPATTIAELEEAIALAHAVGRVDLEASAWVQLVFVTLVRANDIDTAQRHLPDARATVALEGSERVAIRLLSVEALLSAHAGDLDAAQRRLEDAVHRAEAIDPPLHATMLDNLAGVVAQRGDLDRARTLQEHALRAD